MVREDHFVLGLPGNVEVLASYLGVRTGVPGPWTGLSSILGQRASRKGDKVQGRTSEGDWRGEGAGTWGLRDTSSGEERLRSGSLGPIWRRGKYRPQILEPPVGPHPRRPPRPLPVAPQPRETPGALGGGQREWVEVRPRPLDPCPRPRGDI